MAGRARRVAIYARVSTDGQSVENQLRDLAAVAERHCWEVAATYTDEGVSGAKGHRARIAKSGTTRAAMKRRPSPTTETCST